MKLRLDLLEHLTADDILNEALASQHRFKPEPVFSKTGIGYLSPTTLADAACETERGSALTRELTKRMRQAGIREGNSR